MTRHQIELHQLNHNDLEDIVKLSAKIGWDYTESDLNTIFSCGTVFGHKCLNKVISCSALFPYENFASVGMVIVDPEYQGHGLGKAVVQACLNTFQNKPVTLVSTSEGLPLYSKLGFQPVGTLHKLIASEYQSRESFVLNHDLNCRDYMETDFYEVVRFDAAAFGAKRETFLRQRIFQANHKLVVTDQFGKIAGFGLSILLPEMLLIGPIIADNDFIAHYLINKLSTTYSGKLRIDVLSNKDTLIEKLIHCGFEIVNQPPVLGMNAELFPSRNNHLYAIAAQAFG
ncbi:GNAT family N-acetyltransferase [Paenibacillus caui]|uniref:GNAT family N-acetyltransferase n=1 Tax=Paenibacillus caui TaxID=2873927 RepID=UPI001CA9AF5D|nr:GNAT family N-acetyltransferase [Paenibacillus caui]